MMSNLPINDHSGDNKDVGFFSHNIFDNFFNSFTSHFPTGHDKSTESNNKSGFINPKVDITENKEAYNLTAELPGLDPNDINLDLSNGVITLSGHKKYEKSEEKDDNVYVMERSYGSFQRSFRVPDSVEQDAINADFKKGVLKVLLPKSSTARQQQRSINIGS